MPLTEEEVEQVRRQLAQLDPEAIAERAAERTLDIISMEVGKSVIRKVAWAAGVVLVGLLAWLGSKGFLK